MRSGLKLLSLLLLAVILCVSCASAVTPIEKNTYISQNPGVDRTMWFGAIVLSVVLIIISVRGFFYESTGPADAITPMICGMAALIPTWYVAMNSNAVTTLTSAGVVGSSVVEYYSISSYPVVGMVFMIVGACLIVYNIATTAMFIQAASQDKEATGRMIIPAIILLLAGIGSAAGVIVVGSGITAAPVDTAGNTTSESVNASQAAITNASAAAQTGGGGGLVLLLVLAIVIIIVVSYWWAMSRKKRSM